MTEYTYKYVGVNGYQILKDGIEYNKLGAFSTIRDASLAVTKLTQEEKLLGQNQKNKPEKKPPVSEKDDGEVSQAGEDGGGGESGDSRGPTV